MGKHGNRSTKENADTVNVTVKTEEVAETTAEKTVEPEDTTAAAEVTDGANAPEEETVNTDVVAEENSDETLDQTAPETTVSNDTTDEEQPTEEPAPVTDTTVEEQTAAKYVEVVCDQLYFRPEPNKVGAPLGVLTKGEQLVLVESDAKLPEGWIEVYRPGPKGLTGYVVKEFVKEV